MVRLIDAETARELIDERVPSTRMSGSIVFQAKTGGLTELRKEIGNLNVGLKEEISTVKIDLGKEISGTKTELRTEVEKVRTDVEKVKSDVLRWMFLFWVGQLASIIGILG